MEGLRDAQIESSEDLRNVKTFARLRNALKEYLAKFPPKELYGNNWRDDLEGIRIADVVVFPWFEFLKNMKLVVDENECWFPVSGGYILTKVRYGVVTAFGDGRLVLRVFTTFGDTPKHHKRNEKVHEHISGKERWALDSYI